MNNSYFILLSLALLGLFNTNLTAQSNKIDHILDTPDEGIRFIVSDDSGNYSIDTSSIQSHPDDGHGIYLRVQASRLHSSNNLIIGQKGFVGIGLEDPCTKSIDIDALEDKGILFWVNNGLAVRADGQTDWDIPSDIRLKENVTDFTDGLEVIRQIDPISYEYNGKAGTIKGQKAIGISAQKMLKAAPYTVKRDGNKNAKKGTGFLSYNGTAVRYILINAVKELDNKQQESEEALKYEVETLQSEVIELSQTIEEFRTALQVLRPIDNKQTRSLQRGQAVLGQNIPNPFRNTSTINYRLADHTQEAHLKIFTTEGRFIQQINLDTAIKKGSVEITRFDLNGSGSYLYTLEIDGKIIESKKMTLK